MEIDESSKTIESTTPNMRNIFSNPQLNSTTERSASTEKSKTDSSQDKITAFLEFLNADFRTKEQIQEYLDVNIKCLYENSNFRHSYFNISAYLQIHRLELNEKKLQEKKPISENLKILKDEIIVEEQYSKIRIKIFKFIDHCNLELSRFAYFESVYWRSEAAKDEFRRIKDDYEKLNKKRKNIDRRMLELKKDLTSSKSEYVTILSIFAAIMLASLGGLSFLSSTLKSINDVSIFRLIAICSVCGLVLFNTTFMLLYMIARIINRPIYSFCESAEDGKDCTLINNKCQHKCKDIVRIQRRLPYVFWVNFVLFFFLVLDVVAYFLIKYGLIEGIYRFLIPIASVAGLWILVITVILLFIEVISSLSKKYFK